MQDFFRCLFFVVEYARAASLLLAVVEFIGMWRLIPFVFKIGPKIMVRQMPLEASPETFQVPAEGETKGGKFRRIQDGSYIFRDKMPLLRISTPFPIKGTLTVRGTTVEVHGRIPLSTTLFIGTVLIGYTSTWLIRWAAGASCDTSFLLMGWGTAVLMVGISFPLEIFRAKKVVKELLELLQGRSA